MTVTVCEFPPPVPLTTMLNVPLVALRFTVTFIVELPLPAIELGLKLIVVPLFCPEADNEIEEMLPWVTVVVILVVPEEPLATLRDVGLAPMVKLDGAAVTVRLTVVASTVPSAPVPVTVTLVVPVAAVALATKVIVVFPEGPKGFVPYCTVTPEGRPETDKVIVLAYPPKGVLVTVEAPLVPCTIETAVAESVKPEVGTAPVSAAKRPVFGLPHPVTRS